MNHYDTDFPDKKVGIQGLTMSNPDSVLSQLFVSSDRIWVHFEEPDSLTYAGDQGWKMINQICNFLDIDTLSRASMRIQYAVATSDLQKTVTRVVQHSFSPRLQDLLVEPNSEDDALEFQERFQQWSFSLPVRHETLRIDMYMTGAQYVRKAPKNRHLPDHLVVLDIDGYQNGTFSLLQGRRIGKEVEQWASRTMPDLLVDLLEED